MGVAGQEAALKITHPSSLCMFSLVVGGGNLWVAATFSGRGGSPQSQPSGLGDHILVHVDHQVVAVEAGKDLL